MSEWFDVTKLIVETIGWISKVEDGATGTKFVLAVDELTYRPPLRRPNE